MDRRGFMIGLLSLCAATPANAKGCWRPNGWCRRQQRQRDRRRSTAEQREAAAQHKEWLESLEPGIRMRVMDHERRREEELARAINAWAAERSRCSAAHRHYERLWFPRLRGIPRPDCTPW